MIRIYKDIQKIGKSCVHINRVKIKRLNTHANVVMESFCVWHIIYEEQIGT
jgi:hypothetical protein